MSRKVATLVYERRVGSSARKAVLAYFADRADDYGQGIFASKQTIADETELGRSTVIRIVNDFVSEGILIVAGSRPCRNGSTVNYDINLAAVRALPPIKKTPDQSQSGTSPQRDQSQSGTPPVPERDPKGSQSGTQTVHEPSMNPEAADAGARIADLQLVSKLTHALGFDHHGQTPKYWASPDAALIVSRWQTDLGLTSNEVLHVAVSNMRAHGSPANGPRILIKHMQDYAAAKSAPPLEPTKGPSHAQRQPAHDRRAAAADDAFAERVSFAARNRSPTRSDFGFG